MNSCKAPTCQYSEGRGKCVRPNAYIEDIAWCKRNGIKFEKCKEGYNKKHAQKHACERYEERLVYVPHKKVKVCPEGKVLNPRTNRCIKIAKEVPKRIRKENVVVSKRIESDSSSIPEAPPNTLKSSSRKASPKKKSSENILKFPTQPKESSSKSSSQYSRVFKKPQIEKNTAKYFKKKATTYRSPKADVVKKDDVIKASTRKIIKHTVKKDDIKKDVTRKITKHTTIKKTFLKDIFDDNKNAMKEMSSLDILPMISKTPKEISNLSVKIKKIREKNAANKIKNFLIDKIIKRQNTVEDRIKYYKFIQEYLKNTKRNECLTSKRFIDKKKVVNDGFVVGNFLKLVKRIGSNSEYGIVYKTVANNTILTVATKLMPINRVNKNEILLNDAVTELVRNRLSRHFLLAYKTYECRTPNSDDGFPRIIKHTDYFLALNELANGDLESLCKNSLFLQNGEIVINVALQCLLSIVTFHSLGYTHNDCHWGNFLYQATKNVKGYYEYSIFGETYYVKNCGYNIMIMDYGFVKKRTSENIDYNRMVGDYERVMNAFLKKLPNTRENAKEFSGWINSYPKQFEAVSDFMKSLKTVVYEYAFHDSKKSEDRIFKTIIQTFMKGNTVDVNLVLSNLPAGEEVINKGHPFIICDDIYAYAKDKGYKNVNPVKLLL